MRRTFANIYPPKENNAAFFLNLFKQLNDFTCEDIIGGDFNMVPDLEKDKFGGIPKTCQNCVKII